MIPLNPKHCKKCAYVHMTMNHPFVMLNRDMVHCLHWRYKGAPVLIGTFCNCIDLALKEQKEKP